MKSYKSTLADISPIRGGSAIGRRCMRTPLYGAHYSARTVFTTVKCVRPSLLQLAGTSPAGREGVAEVREQNLLLLRGTAHAILQNSLELNASIWDLKLNFVSQLSIHFLQSKNQKVGVYDLKLNHDWFENISD